MIGIGTLAQKAQCSVPTIRFYEKVGLMPSPDRASGGQRRYGRTDLARLMFIRRCRDLDIPLERIKALLDLKAKGQPCDDTLSFFRAQKQVLKARIAALQAFDILLSSYISDCEGHCLPMGAPCGIFQTLEKA
jgi:MerR family transcriptional regulator, copper efflux regulator